MNKCKIFLVQAQEPIWKNRYFISGFCVLFLACIGLLLQYDKIVTKTDFAPKLEASESIPKIDKFKELAVKPPRDPEALPLKSKEAKIEIKNEDKKLESNSNVTKTFGWVMIFTIVFGFCIYLLPTIIANHRKHTNQGAIFVLNLFLGWTFLGWIIALIWSFTSSQNDWRNHPASAKQLAYLDNLGAKYDELKITKGEASDLITKFTGK